MRHHGQEFVLHRIDRLGLRTAGLFARQRHLALLVLMHARGLVAHDLGIALEVAVMQYRGDADTVEAAAVLAQVPPFVLGPAMRAHAAPLAVGHARQPVVRQVQPIHAGAQHVLLGIAEIAFGTLVPGRDQSLLVGGDDRVVVGAVGHQPHPFLADARLGLGLASAADVDEGHHGAFDLVFCRAVRQQAHEVVASVVTAQLALDGVQGVEGRRHVVGQLAILEPVRDVEQRAPDIGGDDREDIGRARREALDAYAPVDEDGGDVGGRDQVVQVVVCLAGLFHLHFQFVVDGDQFLVHRLQLFLARFELFGGRTQLFVDGLQFFIRGAMLLVRHFGMFDGFLQFLLIALQFGFELVQHQVLRLDRILARLRIHRPFDFLEQDQDEAGSGDLVGKRPDDHVDEEGRAIALRHDPVRFDTVPGLERLVQGHAQLEPEFRQHQRHHIARRLAADVAQETPGGPGHVDDVRIAVDDQARRRELRQRALVHLAIRKLGPQRRSGMRRLRQALRLRARQRWEVAHRPRQGTGAIDTVLLVERHKKFRRRIRRFRRAEEQETIRIQGRMEFFQHPQLGFPVQVDQHVTARDHVQPREWRIAQQVVRRKQDAVAHRLADAVTPVFLGEELTQLARRHIHGDRRGIAACTRERDRVFVDIGCEQLHLGRLGQGRPMFGQHHGDRIRLLAGGAGGDPDPDLLAGLLVAEQFGHHRVFHGIERLTVAEEGRHADQEVFQQQLEFHRFAFQQLGIVGQRHHALDQQAALDAAQYRGALVVAEVVTGVGAQRRDDALQGFFIAGVGAAVILVAVGAWRFGFDGRRGQSHVARSLPQVDQFHRHLGGRQHEIDHPGGDGGDRHAIVVAVGGLLRQRDATEFLHPPQADRAVRSGAGQDDGNRAPLVRFGQGAEEQIDRGVPAGRALQGGHRQVAVIHRQLQVRRDHIDVPRLDR